jgi:LmbE family N-acetylglucosaminyl deacetylase
MATSEPNGRAVLGVLSPHLDDAVLSCGSALMAHPESHVVTVFASGPSSVDPLPSWDRRCGDVFAIGDDVMAFRREEDRSALSLAGAVAHHLEFWDWQYRKRQHGYDGLGGAQLLDAIAFRFTSLVEALPVSIWAIPLGIFHRDHKLTCGAALKASKALPEKNWVVYEDLPYARRQLETRLRLRWLRRRGARLEHTQLRTAPDRDGKAHLVHAYVSQQRALGSGVEIALQRPEVYYRLTW